MRSKDILPVKLSKKARGFFRKTRIIGDVNAQIKDVLKKKEIVQKEFASERSKFYQLRAKTDHLHDIYSGLQALKNLKKLPPQKAENKAIEILKTEIKRLEDLVALQREELTKNFYTSPLLGIQEPILKKSYNPIRFLKNVGRYNKEKKEYKAIVRQAKNAESHITLGKGENTIHISNNGTRNYKSEQIREKVDYMEVGDKVVATYYLADIPAYLNPYVFFKLISSSLPFTMSMFIKPTVNSSLIKLARQRLSVLEMQQQERVTKGKMRDVETEKHIEETSIFLEDLVHEVERGIEYRLFLSLEAKDKDELKMLHKELKNLSESMEFSFAKFLYGQKKAFESTLPFNSNNFKHNRVIQSSGASYLIPFVSKQIHDPDGVFVGINAYHDSLVFLNPFSVRNNNVNILGVSGAGKSVTAKTLATRLYMRGTQIIIIDPEGEYVDFAKALGGEVVQFSRDNGINPFSVDSHNENDILDHITTLKTFFRFFIPDDVYESAVLDKVLVELYKNGEPTFEKFLKSLQKDPMYEHLNVLNDGSLRGVFNSKRELELTNDLIVFDISPIGDNEMRAPAMYLLTSLIWQLVNKKSDRKRMLFIDEAHKLLNDRAVAIFYREMVKQARKRNLGVVSITQDVEDFLHKEFGRAIITNSETKILLKQSYATLKLLEDVFPMTTEEKKQLGNLNIGEMVLFRENEHMRVDVMVLPREEAFIFPQSYAINQDR